MDEQLKEDLERASAHVAIAISKLQMAVDAAEDRGVDDATLVNVDDEILGELITIEEKLRKASAGQRV